LIKIILFYGQLTFIPGLSSVNALTKITKSEIEFSLKKLNRK